ncbi:MAG: hypothetical protein ACXWKN_09420 [Phenylobacterium sp.]
MANLKRSTVSSSVTVLGVVGFVGLLVSSHYAPNLATQLQLAALVWFSGFGAVRYLLQRGR